MEPKLKLRVVVSEKFTRLGTSSKIQHRGTYKSIFFGSNSYCTCTCDIQQIAKIFFCCELINHLTLQIFEFIASSMSSALLSIITIQEDTIIRTSPFFNHLLIIPNNKLYNMHCHWLVPWWYITDH